MFPPLFLFSLFLLLFCVFLCSLHVSTTTAIHNGENTPTSIVFATLGRSSYAFDIYSIPASSPTIADETQLTDGESVNFNGNFPSSSIFSLLYITERNGSSSVYLDKLSDGKDGRIGRRSMVEDETGSDRPRVCLAGCEVSNGRVSMKDRPSLVGEHLVYVSTHEDSGARRASWVAVYSTHLRTGSTRRLTPYGVADFSPAVSPSGVWTAVASCGEKGWDGEIEELGTDIYVFLTLDGSSRVKVVEHGGWPSWADDSAFYFHRRGEDGWWSVYVAVLPRKGSVSIDSVVTRRVTPPGLHAFTPAASVANKSFIAVATRRPSSDFRHVELYDVVSNSFKELTRLVNPQAHHFNPFISPDSFTIGYHRCARARNGRKSDDLFLENIKTPKPDISLFRIDGSFPSFSPDGTLIAYVKFPGVYVAKADGSGHAEIISGTAFSTSWNPNLEGLIYTSVGPTFAGEDTKVDVVSINIENKEFSYKKLTYGGENNAFASPSPDGKRVVFRSGRSGHKNLYIMDSLEGEMGFLERLTDGPWTDTMCNWSPDGDWIAFSSDRENPGSGSFGLFLIHPNKTGLRKLFGSGLHGSGRANHPYFSPDGKYLVFTSDDAAVSAEPISNPHHFQPYGDIFTIKLDGSDLTRLTHNSYEDGTPAWGPKYMRPVSVEWPVKRPKCEFDDCHWLNARPKHVRQVSYLSNSSHQCGQQ